MLTPERTRAGPSHQLGTSPNAKLIQSQRSGDNEFSSERQAFPRVDRDFVSDRYRAWWQALTLDDITDEDLRRQSAGLAALGPRATYEFCRGLLNGRDIIESLADFERLDPGVLAYLGGDRLPIAEALQ